MSAGLTGSRDRRAVAPDQSRDGQTDGSGRGGAWPAICLERRRVHRSLRMRKLNRTVRTGRPRQKTATAATGTRGRPPMRIGPPPSRPAPSAEAIESKGEIGLENRQGSCRQFMAGNGDDVQARTVTLAGAIGLKPSENIPKPPFCGIANDRASDLTRGHDPEPVDLPRVGQAEEGEIACRKTAPALLDEGEVRARPKPNDRSKPLRHECPGWRGFRPQPAGQTDRYRDETVSRFRPFARRRLRTIRPFLVCIRTRKPWVRARRRRFG